MTNNLPKTEDKALQNITTEAELLLRSEMATKATDAVCNCNDFPNGEVVHRMSQHEAVKGIIVDVD